MVFNHPSQKKKKNMAEAVLWYHHPKFFFMFLNSIIEGYSKFSMHFMWTFMLENNSRK